MGSARRNYFFYDYEETISIGCCRYGERYSSLCARFHAEGSQ